MKHHVALLFLLFSISSLTSCIDDSSPTLSGSRLRVGDRLPHFQVETTDGTIITTDTLLNKTSVIVFFNTQCPDCREELPTIDSLHLTFSNKPEFQLICIAREESAESILEYWQAHHFAMPVAPQADRTLFHLFAYSGIPHIFISNHDGIIQHIHNEREKPKLKQLIQEINNATSIP
jgi:peroxiredoxin